MPPDPDSQAALEPVWQALASRLVEVVLDQATPDDIAGEAAGDFAVMQGLVALTLNQVEALAATIGRPPQTGIALVGYLPSARTAAGKTAIAALSSWSVRSTRQAQDWLARASDDGTGADVGRVLVEVFVFSISVIALLMGLSVKDVARQSLRGPAQG